MRKKRVGILQMPVNYVRRMLNHAASRLKSKAWRKATWSKTIIFFKLFIKRINEERIPRESAALAYVTILGFIPFITFIIMIAPDLPFFNVKGKIADVVAQHFIPGSAQAVMDMIGDMISRRMSLNIMAFSILLISAYLLFNNIQRTFDRILSTQTYEKNDIISQFVKFIGTLVFGLIILVLLFSSSSLPIISRIVKLRLFTWMTYILPFIMQFFLLYFLYIFFPSVRIKNRSIITGALWTTVIWVLLKSVFDQYIYNLTSYQAVYGVLAALPIFLFWIYVNWIIILSGVVLVSILDERIRRDLTQKDNEHYVKISIEMFSDKNLNKRLEDYVLKNSINDLVEIIDEDEDE